MAVCGRAKPARPGANVRPEEVARFARTAGRWWDVRGPAAPLHRLNPVRLDFIRDAALKRFGRDGRRLRPFGGLSAVDVGCGGGLVSEPLARMGFTVTGVDADETAVAVARAHAETMGLAGRITYRPARAEELVCEGVRFDLVCCLELLEHVPDPRRLIGDLAMLVRGGGLVVLSTLNRTALSFLAAILGAEYLLGWLPRGTHDWNSFITPAELDAWLEEAGLEVEARSGIAYDPLADRFRRDPDMRVNYLVAAAPKPAAG